MQAGNSGKQRAQSGLALSTTQDTLAVPTSNLQQSPLSGLACAHPPPLLPPCTHCPFMATHGSTRLGQLLQQHRTHLLFLPHSSATTAQSICLYVCLLVCLPAPTPLPPPRPGPAHPLNLHAPPSSLLLYRCRCCCCCARCASHHPRQHSLHALQVSPLTMEHQGAMAVVAGCCSDVTLRPPCFTLQTRCKLP